MKQKQLIYHLLLYSDWHFIMLLCTLLGGCAAQCQTKPWVHLHTNDFYARFHWMCSFWWGDNSQEVLDAGILYHEVVPGSDCSSLMQPGKAEDGLNKCWEWQSMCTNISLNKKCFFAIFCQTCCSMPRCAQHFSCLTERHWAFHRWTKWTWEPLTQGYGSWKSLLLWNLTNKAMLS